VNIEEIDKWLYNEYGISYTKLEKLHDYFFEKYIDQKEEIERLNKELEQEKKDFKEANDKCFELIIENKRLNNIINEVRKKIKLTESKERFCIKYIQIDRNRYDSIIKLLDKGE